MRLPLFERFPGTETLPRVELCSLPTPVQPLVIDELSGRYEVKRDDLTSAAYGGNKVRKLEFLLGQAVAEGRRAVLTFGAYGSNHALATAVHASALGLEPHVVLSPQEPGPFAAATLRAHARLHTVLHPVEGWDGSAEAAIAARSLTERDGIEPLVIPMGGTNAVGATGYVNAALELLEQADAEPDAVYVAGGTLGTAVGLAIGFAAAGARTRVCAVRVTPSEIASSEVAAALAAETVGLLRSLDAAFPELSYADLAVELREEWFEPGYGVVTPETTAAVEAAAEAGIKLETTYTGKAMAALLADAAAHRFDGERVVFWDTYSSAPMPAAGDVEELPEVLQDYVAVCDEMFGPSLTTPSEGSTL